MDIIDQKTIKKTVRGIIKKENENRDNSAMNRMGKEGWRTIYK